MSLRICIVTAGNLSTSPRMLKAADTFSEAGHRVHLISARRVKWAIATDDEVRKSRSWDWSVVDYDRESATRTYARSGVRFHSGRLLAKVLGPPRCPLFLAARAYSRIHTELLRAALAQDADLYYGGTTGALAAVAIAGRTKGVAYALDLEDFHSAEQDSGPDATLVHGLCEKIEWSVLPGAVFLTAAGAAITSTYAEKYGLHPIAVHNTFPLPSIEPTFAPGLDEGLRLYWFSQTIGPRRGLEDAIQAMGLAGIPGELHLRGRAIPDYLESLRKLGKDSAPRLKIIHHHPAPPDSMVDLCREYDVGLAVEPGFSLNNSIALSNKVFTYMLAGLAVAFTDTPGQRPLAQDLEDGAIIYKPGEIETLAAGLKCWARDKQFLRRAKVASWEAAKRRWHWEHPAERGMLLDAVARAI